MKFAIVFLAVLVIAVSAVPQYTTKFDNIDVEQILKSDRLLNNYLNCLLNDGPCTADGKELKNVLPDALATECSKCSEKQKNGSEIVIKFLSKNKPEVWKKVLDKYDQDGKYRLKYGDKAKEAGISV